MLRILSIEGESEEEKLDPKLMEPYKRFHAEVDSKPCSEALSAFTTIGDL